MSNLSNHKLSPHANSLPKGQMEGMNRLGVPWWNDSCDPDHLAEAVAHGAVGATSNPVIVSAAVDQNRPRWLPVIDRCVRDMPAATEDEIAWALIAEMGREAARILEPIHARTNGRDGCLCLQVNPKYYRSTERMVEHGRELAGLAPNIAIKIPATAAGIAATRQLVAVGIRVNVTVSFTVSQALAAAQAIEAGHRDFGADPPARSYVTLMIGRIDDQLRRTNDQSVEPAHEDDLTWAGIALFKRAARLFRHQGFACTLLAAAYRHPGHWSEIIGPDVLQSIPYAAWKAYDAGDVAARYSLADPVDPDILERLNRLKDFRTAYNLDQQQPEDFVRYGAARHTLRQFLEGYETLLAIVRKRMLD
jgi:transaldolase